MFSNQDLLRLIIPLIIEQILAVTVGMMDTMMVSSAGEAATSGVSLVDMITNLIINVFAAVATGGAVVTSQYLGRKDEESARESAGQLLIVTALIAVGIMMFCLAFREVLLVRLYGDLESDVLRNAVIYLVICALSYPFLAVYNSCAALFRSMGNSRISMQVSVVMNLINVAGNAYFIFRMGWGVAGAALATLISRMVACIVLFIRLHNPKLQVYLSRGWLKWDGTTIRRILHIGIPNGIENSIFQLGRVLVVSIIASFGTIQIAANAVANNFDGMGVLPGQAMNLAIITVVGQCVGAEDYGQAEYYARKMLKITYVILGIWSSLVILTLPLTLRFYGLSYETLKLAFILILIHDGCGIVMWPASFTLPNVLRAAGDVKYPMVVSVTSMLVFRIGLSYIIAQGMGLGAVGVWIAMVVDWVARMICFVKRYRSGKWKMKAI